MTGNVPWHKNAQNAKKKKKKEELFSHPTTKLAYYCMIFVTILLTKKKRIVFDRSGTKSAAGESIATYDQRILYQSVLLSASAKLGPNHSNHSMKPAVSILQ